MNAQGQYGTPVKATATGTTTTTATLTGIVGTTFYVTDISGSSDLSTAAIQVKDGSTVIWQDKVGNTIPYVLNFNTPLKATSGNTLTVVVTGTSASNANVSGYSTP